MNNINEVIANLTQLVTECEQNESAVGYFAALYLDVTRTIKEAIDKGNVFENNARLEAIDVCFASRYFDAITALKNGTTPTLPWQITFDALKMNHIIVDQHLIAAANAHINFDLSIAVAQTCSGNAIYTFKNDFDTMNTILFTMNNAVNGMITKIWPPVSVLLHLFGSDLLWIEDAVMKKNRSLAWQSAVRLATSDLPVQLQVMREMEVAVWRGGAKLMMPPWWLQRIFDHIAKNEKGDVTYRIHCLIEKMASH